MSWTDLQESCYGGDDENMIQVFLYMEESLVYIEQDIFVGEPKSFKIIHQKVFSMEREVLLGSPQNFA